MKKQRCDSHAKHKDGISEFETSDQQALSAVESKHHPESLFPTVSMRGSSEIPASLVVLAEKRSRESDKSGDSGRFCTTPANDGVEHLFEKLQN